MNLGNIDVSGFAADLVPIIKDGLLPFIQGEEGDLHEFAWRIARNFAAAISSGDHTWGEEIKAQVRGLIELARIRAKVAEIEMIQHVLGLIFRVAVTALGAAIKGA